MMKTEIMSFTGKYMEPDKEDLKFQNDECMVTYSFTSQFR